MLMKKIEVRLIRTPEPHAGGETWYSIKVITDEGIYGLGESMPHFAFHSMERSYARLMEDVFERWFKDKDPFQRDHLIKIAYNAFCAGHPDMLGLSLLSAVEMAMWDICGKALNRPVYDLLGGAHRDRLRAYAYISYEDMGGNGKNYADIVGDPGLVSERAQEMIEMGFTALKIDPLEYRIPLNTQPDKPYPLEIEDFRKTQETMDALKAVTDGKCDVLLGTHGQMTTASAIRYAKFVEQYHPFFMEEPVPPGNLEEMAKVKHSTGIPIAAGERIMTVYEASRAMEADALSVLQPDLGTCGGISEAKKMAAICEAHYVDLSPHLWGGPILISAAVQLSLSIPNFLIQESILTMKGFYSDITSEFLKWEKGYIYPSDKPGLGIELDESVINTVILK
jgi:2-dehydro-3-deoxyphosphogalactonate aldolase